MSDDYCKQTSATNETSLPNTIAALQKSDQHNQ